jgi:hypothetical protein
MGSNPALIAHVVYRFGIGGLENGIVNLVNRMPASRWRHAIVALTDVCPDFVQRIERPDVRCIALGKRPGHLVRDYPRLYRLFRELGPAVVHTRNLAALEAVVPAWAARVPVRIHGEHGWDMRDPVGRRVRYRRAPTGRSWTLRELRHSRSTSKAGESIPAASCNFTTA